MLVFHMHLIGTLVKVTGQADMVGLTSIEGSLFSSVFFVVMVYVCTAG